MISFSFEYWIDWFWLNWLGRLDNLNLLGFFQFIFRIIDLGILLTILWFTIFWWLFRFLYLLSFNGWFFCFKCFICQSLMLKICFSVLFEYKYLILFFNYLLLFLLKGCIYALLLSLLIIFRDNFKVRLNQAFDFWRFSMCFCLFLCFNWFVLFNQIRFNSSFIFKELGTFSNMLNTFVWIGLLDNLWWTFWSRRKRFLLIIKCRVFILKIWQFGWVNFTWVVCKT